MKNKVLTGLFIFAAVCLGQRSYAQTATSGPVTVNINLTDAISITLGADPTVNFNYMEAADYTEVQTVEKTGHFTVVSNQEYNLTVQAVTAFSPAGPALDIVTVSVDPGTLNGGTPVPNVPLNTEPAPLLNGADPSTGALYTVNYEIADATTLLGLPDPTYTTTVTYTATQL